MYVELNKISGNARCWIYTLENINRNISEDINKFLTKLCENWMTHGEPVKASYKVYNDSYIILFAEKSISGCSIDDANKIRSAFGLGVDWFTPIGPLNFSFSHVTYTSPSQVGTIFVISFGLIQYIIPRIISLFWNTFPLLGSRLLSTFHPD